MKYQEAAEAVAAELASLDDIETPSLDLSQRMVGLLAAFWVERQDELHGRMDELIADLGEHQAKLGSSELTQAYQADTMGRTRQILLAVLSELGVPLPTDQGEAQLEQLLSLLIQYWRAELLRRSGENQQLKDAHQSLITIASGSGAPTRHS